MRNVLLVLILVFTISTMNAQSKAKEMKTRIAGISSLPEFIDFLRLPNDAYQPEQLEANIEWALNAFTKRRFSVRRLTTEGIDLVFAERRVPNAEKTVLIYVQIDGQPVDNSKWEQESPFKPVLKERAEDGTWRQIDLDKLKGPIDPEWRIFARSASDAKGPILAFLAAVDLMDSKGEKPNYNIKVIMDNEEEIGSPNLAAAIDRYKDILAADALIILDGPMHPSNKPTLVFGARGITTMRLTTYGPEVPQHSGHYGNYVPNPAIRLCQLIASIKDEEGRVTIPGYYDGIVISAEVDKLLEAVPDDEDAIREHIGIAEADRVANSLQRAIQYPSFNVRGMQSAWVGNKVRTIVPHAAVADIDIRTVMESDPDRLVSLIYKHIEDQGYHFCDGEPTAEERMKYPKLISSNYRVAYDAFRTDFDEHVGQWLAKALKNTFYWDPIMIRTHGGSIPIAPFVNKLGIPAVIIPIVNPDNNQHSPNENIRLFNYLQGVKTYYGILTEDF